MREEVEIEEKLEKLASLTPFLFAMLTQAGTLDYCSASKASSRC